MKKEKIFIDWNNFVIVKKNREKNYSSIIAHQILWNRKKIKI